MENTRKYQDNYPYIIVHINEFEVRPLRNNFAVSQSVVLNKKLRLSIHAELIPLIGKGLYQFWYEEQSSDIQVKMFRICEIPNP